MTGKKPMTPAERSLRQALQRPMTHAELVAELVASGLAPPTMGTVGATWSRQPRTRAAAAAFATGHLRQRTERRIRRTAELTAQGLTAREIGRIIATEEGEEPFAISTVKGWRGRGRGSQP
jgi:hypothetical protein